MSNLTTYAHVITEEELKNALPNKLKSTLNPALVHNLNTALTDEVVAENIRDNIIGYTSVLKDGRFKLEDYLNAVKYVSYKLLGDSNEAAYGKTFPIRYQTLLAKGADKKTISSYTTAYNKNKLVNLIYEQTLIPTHILNADVYQKAINTQALLMVSAKSEKVRSDAANSILNHLKAPEKSEIELKVTHGQGSVMEDLRAATQTLVNQQLAAIQEGSISAKQIAKQSIHSVTIEDGEIVDGE